MKTNTKHWASITAGILSLAGYTSASSLGSEKYTYDASGNIIEKSIDGQVTQMTYDSSNRLTERQATGQSETTAYDAAGRPIAMKDGTGQPTRSMNYGYGDKVLETKNHDTNTGFFYNAEGQLVGKKTDSGVATYTWDANVLAADNAVTFTNESHTTGGVPMLESGKSMIVSDYLGNTLASAEKRFTSTAFGDGLEAGRFTGKPYVKELDCYVFHWRNYSAKFSMWLTSDPTGYPDGINNQEYAKNDPVNNIDPLGLTVQPWPGNGVVWNHTDCSGAGDKAYFDADGWHITTTTGGPPTTSSTFTTYETSAYLAQMQFHNPPYVIVSAVGTGMDMHWCRPGDSSYTAKVTDADNFHYVGPKAGTPSFQCGSSPITPLPKYIGPSTLSVYEM